MMTRMFAFSLIRLRSKFLVVALVPLLGVAAIAPEVTGDSSSTDDAASLQKKANEVQARIRANQDDTGELKRAIKLNDVTSAKEVLLKHGFTGKDLENTKIILRTGGGKGGEDTIEILAACCDPREITIRRTLEHFTK